MFRPYLYVLLVFFVLYAKVQGINVRECECGLVNTISNRIVGGWEAKPNDYPWLASIYLHGNLYCGGSIINSQHILTAGHCVRGLSKEDLKVVVGQHRSDADSALHIKIKKIILHKHFLSHVNYDENDIAILRLKHPIEFGYKVWPICLPKHDYLRKGENTYYNRNATIAGWGKLGEHLQPSLTLQESLVEVLTPEECLATHMGKYVTKTVYCAYAPGTDSCQGDSGGPMFIKKTKSKFEQIGVVSWGIGCASQLPGIYTKVYNYVKWIHKNTKSGFYCTNN